MASMTAYTRLLPRCIFGQSASVRCLATTQVATIPLPEFKLYKLDAALPRQTELTRDDAVKYVTDLLRIRRMETAAGNMYKSKNIRGFCHLYSGEEAVTVGIEAALKPGDAMTTSYRCHGICLTRGAKISEILAELSGKSTGISKGIGGSMHMYYDDFYGGNGIVGAQVPLAVGVGLAYKHQHKANVSIALYGDGASNQGQVFEAYNIAKLWNLPVIFLCENNRYGMGTSSYRSSASVDYYTRAQYIPGIWVDGMDVLSVREAMHFARDWCVTGRGPLVVETETYRYHGHSMSDPGTSYRTREEVQEMRKTRDPITRFQDNIVEAGLVTQDEIKQIEKSIRQAVDKDVDAALSDPSPVEADAFKHVYVSPPPDMQIRGCELDIKMPTKP